jgi:hypothetical protein
VLQFIQVLQRELDAVEKDKDAFIHDFSEVRFPLYKIYRSSLVDLSFTICINSFLFLSHS